MTSRQDLKHEEEQNTSLRVELPLDDQTIERFKACKEVQFPICLDHAVKEIFGDKDLMLSMAEKAGFERRDIVSVQDVWNLYLKLGAAWAKSMGSSVTAVIEYKSLKEMEKMGCTKCPLYEIELDRKKKNYSP